MKLICIIGIDGTGKSTLSRNLVRGLQAAGRPAIYLYGRQYAILSRWVLAWVLRRGGVVPADEFRDYHGFIAARDRVLRRPPVAALYTVAVLADFYARIWRRLLPELRHDRIVVVDRYLYDTVIGDLAVFLGWSDATTARAIAAGLLLLPRPTLTVLLDAPAAEAMARKTDVPHVDYLDGRRQRYLQIQRPEVRRWDGLAPPDELATRLVATVRQRVGARRAAR